MTPTSTTPTPGPATARVPFGTRAVRHVLGAHPNDLLNANRTAPALSALAQQVHSLARRVDELDAQIARDTAHLARDVARIGDAEDAHLLFAWGHLVHRVQHLAIDQLLLSEWHEALNAATHTYARARTSTTDMNGTTADHTPHAAPDSA